MDTIKKIDITKELERGTNFCPSSLFSSRFKFLDLAVYQGENSIF